MTAAKSSSSSQAVAGPVPVDPKQVFQGDVVRLAQQPSKTKGRNVSGRSWKVRPQKRASSLIKTKVNNQSRSWEQRQAEKLARKEALELQKELQEEKRQEAIEKKERRLENERRRAENEYKALVKSGVQTLNNNKVGRTLKAMSKKQLRQIKKTRLNPKTGVVEFVPAYSK